MLETGDATVVIKRRTLIGAVLGGLALAAVPFQWLGRKAVRMSRGGRTIGEFDTLQEALDSIPAVNFEPVVITAAPGAKIGPGVWGMTEEQKWEHARLMHEHGIDVDR